jgi:hypothetical protein
MVAEALEFGGIELPPSATVLGVESEAGANTLYRLAIRIEPGSVDRTLADSGFMAELQQGRRVFMPPVAGFDLDSGGGIASAQDRFRSGDGGELTVIREILVDRSDPAAPIVHLWLFTT